MNTYRLLLLLAVFGCGKETINVRRGEQRTTEERLQKLENAPSPKEGPTGRDGRDGAAGAVGPKGETGSAGPTGPAGADGADAPLSVVAFLNPCGDAAGIYDEIFLKLQNSTIIASMSDNAAGDNTRLSVLLPGTYITSDGDLCYFTVTNAGTIINEHH